MGRTTSGGIGLASLLRKQVSNLWFLADTTAMRSWTGDSSYYEECPEATPNMPWDRLKEVGHARRGRSKVSLARLVVNQHEFDIARAAEHPQCPTARYFVERVSALASR